MEGSDFNLLNTIWVALINNVALAAALIGSAWFTAWKFAKSLEDYRSSIETTQEVKRIKLEYLKLLFDKLKLFLKKLTIFCSTIQRLKESYEESGKENIEDGNLSEDISNNIPEYISAKNEITFEIELSKMWIGEKWYEKMLKIIDLTPILDRREIMNDSNPVKRIIKYDGKYLLNIYESIKKEMPIAKDIWAELLDGGS